MDRLPGIVADVLYNQLNDIEKHTESDVIAINAPIDDMLYGIVKNSIENLKAKSKSNKLTVLITTYGGSAEIAERIVYIFRHHYETVNFIVPDYAYSAGTILCMSGDDIYMDYTSVLGPIDPQVKNKEGKFVPALGYLDKIEELYQKAINGNISQAEFLILKDFDLAELKEYEQARDLTVDLLKEWLVKYKFKNWNKTESSQCEVTKEMKEERAEKIARELSDNNKWHSHGRPLNMEKINRIGLKVKDFGDDKELQKKIREFHNLMLENMQASNIQAQVAIRRL